MSYERSGVRITVLGKSPAWQDAGGACSGYLVEEDGYVLLLDCGNGVFGELRRQLDFAAVDAVLLTHLHGDHFLDLIPFGYALLYAPRPVSARPELHVPPGARGSLRALLGAIGSADVLERAFTLREYHPRDELTLGPLRLRPRLVPHYVPTYAVDVRGGDGARVTFGADCCPNEALTQLARDTDLLIAEATLAIPEPEGDRGHMTAAEAGAQARGARARKLVLTHFSDSLDADRIAAAASAAYGGPVTLAAPGLTLDVRAGAVSVAGA